MRVEECVKKLKSKGIIDMGCALNILCNSHVICHQ